jgi:hypothetical protein
MDREPVEGKPTKTTFVYDRRTGKVVHVHQFVPYERNGTISDREMEEMALSLAPASLNRERLGVLHQGRDLELSPERIYRVDVKTGKLVAKEVVAKSPQATARRRPARRTAAKPATKRATRKR